MEPRDACFLPRKEAASSSPPTREGAGSGAQQLVKGSLEAGALQVSGAFPAHWGGSGGKASFLAVGDRHPEERRGCCRMHPPGAELSVEKLLDPEQGRSGQ